MTHTYPYPRPSLTVDIIILKESEDVPHILLIQRKHPPFEQHWALPGGFVEPEEALEAAARRELEEETALRDMPLQQLVAVGTPGRDPRGWTVSVVFWGWLEDENADARAGDDATNAAWWPLDDLPPLAFDHSDILKLFHKRVGCEM